jgi:hypothetical protein
MPIKITGTTIEITTSRLSATFQGPDLVGLSNPRGQVLARQGKTPVPALAIGFTGAERAPLCVRPYHRVEVVRLGERLAHVHVADEAGDACLRLSIDAEGRLVVEPSAHTLRRGLSSVSWTLPGIARRLKLVAPFYQGCRQDLAHPLVAGKHWAWPFRWEAGLVVLQGKRDGFSVTTFDPGRRPKAVSVGSGPAARSLAFHTELHGPARDTVAVGSLRWVIDTHRGDWQVPAGVYRDWLRREAGADDLRTLRPDWAGDIRLALQWARNDLDTLDAVAKVIDPHNVLIHHSGWRADPYDVNYPEYTAGKEGKSFIDKARRMGFRVMPHFNYFAIDPNHPAFARLRDFVARQFGSQALMAWRWKAGHCPTPPQGFGTLATLRDEKLMYYLHAGASPWRRLLAERIARAMARHKLSAVFVDQTLCTWNLDNALVENLGMAEGMVALTRELTELDGPPAVGGEGLNEMTMRYQTFAQAHLFESHHRNTEHFSELDPVPVFESHHRNTEHFSELDPVPVGDFLYGDLCKTMAYTNIAGDTPETAWRLEVHERLGALPSLVVRGPEDVLKPNPAVKRVLERATG